MGNVEATKVTLLEEWMGKPAGSKHDLIKAKADDLIRRGVAEKTKAPGRPKAKNRAILTTESE